MRHHAGDVKGRRRTIADRFACGERPSIPTIPNKPSEAQAALIDGCKAAAALVKAGAPTETDAYARFLLDCAKAADGARPRWRSACPNHRAASRPTARSVARTLFISRTSPTLANGFISAGAGGRLAAGSSRGTHPELERRIVIEALALRVVERDQQPRDSAERGVRAAAAARRRRAPARRARSMSARQAASASAGAAEGRRRPRTGRSLRRRRPGTSPRPRAISLQRRGVVERMQRRVEDADDGRQVHHEVAPQDLEIGAPASDRPRVCQAMLPPQPPTA